MPQFQHGVASVGSTCATDEGLHKTITVTFPEVFAAPPVFVGTALQDSANTTAPDTFAVSIRSVTASEAVLDVHRVDGGTCWGQSLELGWIAASSTAAAVEEPGLRHGVATVVGSSSSGGYKSITVTFPEAFATSPVVVATALQDPDYSNPNIPDTFAVSVKSLSATQVVLHIQRLDGTSWAQNLKLGWIAVGG
ncbi:MAG: hypothetical protein GY856_48515 [bacterium]|nr:hypothetical protein [bacterium]